VVIGEGREAVTVSKWVVGVSGLREGASQIVRQICAISPGISLANPKSKHHQNHTFPRSSHTAFSYIYPPARLLSSSGSQELFRATCLIRSKPVGRWLV
jgi:hypothetical protein